MNNIPGFHISKEFLQTSQKGDLDRLKKLRSQYNIQDWTVHRYTISGDTALHLATREGHCDVVSYLCEAWDKPSFKTEVANKDMKRPLHEAAQFVKVDVLEYLLKLGVAVDPLKRADWTPLMLACTKMGPEATECVNSLLNYGAGFSLKNKDGWTPLMLACRTGNTDVVKTLISQSPRSEIYVKSKNGRTPLHVAAFHGHRDIIEILLLEDPDQINCRDTSGSTPILEAVKSGDLPTLEYLIKSKADSKVVDNIGQNMLHFAAQSGNIEMIKFIFENHLVDIESRASFGITPLMLAKKNKQLEAVRFLSSLKTNSTGN